LVLDLLHAWHFFPFSVGKPKPVTVNVPPSRGVEIAASLQTALEARQKSNVRPWFDLEKVLGIM
jgi:hypothetical protein